MSGRKSTLHCCERCQVYWTCDSKWQRLERKQEELCCQRCNFYNGCVDRKDQAAMEEVSE